MNAELYAQLRADGYEWMRELPSGVSIGVFRFIYTTALMVGIDAYGYRTRYCYERYDEAVAACNAWDGEGDPPGQWIKQKPENRINPNWAKK